MNERGKLSQANQNLVPSLDVLYSFQGDDGFGIIRKHPVLNVTSTHVVIDECPIGFHWQSKAIKLSREELSADGVAHHQYGEHPMAVDAYYLRPQRDWWEGWRFGDPPAGLVEALENPETAERLKSIVEKDRRSKEAEGGYQNWN